MEATEDAEAALHARIACFGDQPDRPLHANAFALALWARVKTEAELDDVQDNEGSPHYAFQNVIHIAGVAQRVRQREGGCLPWDAFVLVAHLCQTRLVAPLPERVHQSLVHTHKSAVNVTSYLWEVFCDGEPDYYRHSASLAEVVGLIHLLLMGAKGVTLELMDECLDNAFARLEPIPFRALDDGWMALRDARHHGDVSVLTHTSIDAVFRICDAVEQRLQKRCVEARLTLVLSLHKSPLPHELIPKVMRQW